MAEVGHSTLVGQVSANVAPAVGCDAHDLPESRPVGMPVGERIEYDVRHQLVPEGTASVVLLAVEHEIQPIARIEPRLAHAHVVPLRLALVDAHERCAEDRAQAGYAFLRIRPTGSLVGAPT